MIISADDVSEYLAPQTEGVRLVVEIDRMSDSKREARATVDGVTLAAAVEIDTRLGSIEDAPQTANAYTSGDTGSERLGSTLFGALFAGPLSSAWAQAVSLARGGRGLRLVISSPDPNIQALPWELMRDSPSSPRPFALADGWAIERETPRKYGDATIAPAGVAPADLRALALTTDVGVDQQQDPLILRERFSPTHIDVVADIDKRQLLGRLSRPDASIVHILASGLTVRRGTQHLVVRGNTAPEEITAAELRDAIEESPVRARLLVLAGCDTDLVAAGIATVMPNVIGMRGKITDSGCADFLRGLYQALAAGATIDQAVASGRAQQVGFSRSLADEWALPVAFIGDPSPLVVPSPSASAPATDAVERGVLALTEPESSADQIILDMKVSNLQALKEQWSSVEDEALPSFIRDQIAVLDDEVDRLGNGTRR
ncbi:CHAT domain-containing protein [Agromyces protaetiae]|uniref:CHAT domain-containing protein n=1 Tax=Agromyces protaetiae TaxID=2509455 RepID=A0A4P6F952_9MICO|nr:CHAT domain-containing protein [Agromyces protaetiae]QAY72076.1 CHAT domain-containing protein [Agromyces protaetiae]